MAVAILDRLTTTSYKLWLKENDGTAISDFDLAGLVGLHASLTDFVFLAGFYVAGQKWVIVTVDGNYHKTINQQDADDGSHEGGTRLATFPGVSFLPKGAGIFGSTLWIAALNVSVITLYGFSMTDLTGPAIAEYPLTLPSGENQGQFSYLDVSATHFRMVNTTTDIVRAWHSSGANIGARDDTADVVLAADHDTPAGVASDASVMICGERQLGADEVVAYAI